MYRMERRKEENVAFYKQCPVTFLSVFFIVLAVLTKKDVLTHNARIFSFIGISSLKT